MRNGIGLVSAGSNPHSPAMAFTSQQVIQLGLLAAALLVLFLGGFQQIRYLKLAPRVETAADFEAFKKLARMQMYLTVVFLLFAVPGIVMIFTDSEVRPSLAKRLVLWAPFGVMGLFSLFTKSQEKKIQDPVRCAEALRPEFEQVCQSWKKRLLPDF